MRAEGPRSTVVGSEAEGPKSTAEGPRLRAEGLRPRAEGPRPRVLGTRPRAEDPRPRAEGPRLRVNQDYQLIRSHTSIQHQRPAAVATGLHMQVLDIVAVHAQVKVNDSVIKM